MSGNSHTHVPPAADPWNWDHIVAGVLRPARPELARCLRAVEEYSAARADHANNRMRALADIESRIQGARDRVFAVGTGVVTSEMTALEREWREASRDTRDSRDLERLWQRIAPERWLAQPERLPTTLDAVAALAADPDGVDEAELAARALGTALARWDVPVGGRTEWCVARELTFAVRSEVLFAAPVAAAGEVVEHADVQAAHRQSREIRQRLGALGVQTRNSSVGRELGFLAFASTLWAAAALRDPKLAELPNPIAPALRIWRLGYALTGADASLVVLTSLPASG